MNIVIMAGGGGTRLWPLSRADKPKQFQKLMGEATLLELTRDRVRLGFTDDHIYYSVSQATAPMVRALFPQVAEDHVIIEPEKRDTGPAIGFVAASMALIAPDEPFALMPSDNYVDDPDRFCAMLRVAEDIIRSTGKLVDVGATPTWPSGELGYSHIGKQLRVQDGVDVYEFLGHTEKPTPEEAQKLIDSKEYLWHATCFMWTPQAFLNAFKHHAPDMYTGLVAIQDALRKQNQEQVAKLFAQLPKVSVDVAVIEKLGKDEVVMLKAPYQWSDVGLWTAVKRLQEQDTNDVVVEGTKHIGIDTHDSYVLGQAHKLVATIGVSDLVIIDTPDALLVCKKDQSEKVKQLVDRMNNEGHTAYA